MLRASTPCLRTPCRWVEQVLLRPILQGKHAGQAFRTVVVHWPDDLPPVRVARRAPRHTLALRPSPRL